MNQKRVRNSSIYDTQPSNGAKNEMVEITENFNMDPNSPNPNDQNA